MIKKYIDGKFAYPTLTASLLAMICLLFAARGGVSGAAAVEGCGETAQVGGSRDPGL